MSYLQRLLDAAPAPGASPLVPAGGATSPVVGADQRLDIFPGLSTPLGVPPVAEDSAPRRDPPGPAAEAPGPPHPAPQAADAPAVDPPRADAVSDNATPPPAPEQTREQGAMPVEPPMSPWQRIVEADPLPGPGAPGSDPAHDRDPRAAPAMPRQGEEVRQVIEQIIRASADPPAAAERAHMPPHATPAEPVHADGRPAPWPIGVEDFRPLDAPDPQADGAPFATPVARAAAPAAPPRDIGPSPLSTVPETVTRAGPPASAPPPPEREIHTVEHIVARGPDPAPPARMTAADASVIGPIRARRRGPRELAHGRG
jgi:hypothetical protein